MIQRMGARSGHRKRERKAWNITYGTFSLYKTGKGKKKEKRRRGRRRNSLTLSTERPPLEATPASYLDRHGDRLAR